jgi:hypothetical protein
MVTTQNVRLKRLHRSAENDLKGEILFVGKAESQGVADRLNCYKKDPATKDTEVRAAGSMSLYRGGRASWEAQISGAVWQA